MPYHVYELYDPVEHEVRYVGMTEYPDRRLDQHIKQPVNSAMAEWIISLSARGKRPCLHVRYSFYDLHEAISAETDRIKALGTGGNLLNVLHNPLPPYDLSRTPIDELLNLSRIAAAVRTKRGARSMEEAASELGVAKATLFNLEHERTSPDMDTLFKICDWTGLPVDFFRAVENAAA